MKNIIVAPSLLACQKGHEKEQISLLASSGADWLHYDVMDGIFVPNKALSVEECQKISAYCPLLIDVHIMVSDPFNYVEPYAQAGAKVLTFHYEALANDEERCVLLKLIKKNHMKAGISIKPNTPVEALWPLLKEADLVLVMSVEPGKGGQAFLPSALDKITALKAKRHEMGLQYLIEVDGGINNETAPLVINAGVDVIVAGSYLFHKDDVAHRLKILKGE